MRDKNVFEKARMNYVLIPLAGFAAAAALILAAIFAAAYFGAFTRLSDKENEGPPVFSEPEKPEFDYGIETVNENTSADAQIQVSSFKRTDDGVSYEIFVINEGDTALTVKDVRCMLYSGDICIKSSSLSSQLILDERSGVRMLGKENTADADAVIFYVSWEDENGANASTYEVCEIE